MSQQVFISYSRRDGNIYAEKLEQELKSAGYKVWRDTRNINPNQDFTAEIEKGIEASDVIAVCVTPDIRRDNSFVRREIQYADVVQKPAFPCRVTNTIPPISIINKEWLNFYEDWSGAFSRLLTLVADPNLQQPTGEYQAPPDDPFRDYLQALYKQIVRYLDQAVIKLIDLEAETSPDAVPKKQTDDIILEFFDSSIFADVTPDDLPRHTTFKDAFEYHKGRLLLLGEPGAGKTITLMAHAREAVATRLEDPTQALPILKLLATWKSNPPAPLVEWSAGKMDALKPVIAGGKALLLLDGLDELGEERPIDPQKPEKGTYDPRKRLIDAVADLHADNQVLVTCRVKDYAAIGQQIPLDGAITLQPLTDAQLTDYLEDRPEIFAAIQADDQLRDLARTPLLLSLITFAWDKLDTALKDKGDLQAGDVRDAIFEAYCRQRYEHEATKRNADLPFSYQEMMDILGELAMWNAQEWRPGKSSIFDEDSRPEENTLIPYDFAYAIGDNEQAEQFKQTTTHLN
ncbi:MAG: TIR domain-containing protein, partial [Chloroflexota bacterium]